MRFFQYLRSRSSKSWCRGVQYLWEEQRAERGRGATPIPGAENTAPWPREAERVRGGAAPPGTPRPRPPRQPPGTAGARRVLSILNSAITRITRPGREAGAVWGLQEEAAAALPSRGAQAWEQGDRPRKRKRTKEQGAREGTQCRCACVCRGRGHGGPSRCVAPPRRPGVGARPHSGLSPSRVLLAVGQAAVLPDRHGLLLDVVLCEEARLARHHLLDGGRDDHVIDVIVRLPRLPLLWGDDLQDGEGRLSGASDAGLGRRALPRRPAAAPWGRVRAARLRAPGTFYALHQTPRWSVRGLGHHGPGLPTLPVRPPAAQDQPGQDPGRHKETGERRQGPRAKTQKSE